MRLGQHERYLLAGARPGPMMRHLGGDAARLVEEALLGFLGLGEILERRGNAARVVGERGGGHRHRGGLVGQPDRMPRGPAPAEHLEEPSLGALRRVF